jgi:hypothetical protein
MYILYTIKKINQINNFFNVCLELQTKITQEDEQYSVIDEIPKTIKFFE